MFSLAHSFWNLALLYAIILINLLTYLSAKGDEVGYGERFPASQPTIKSGEALRAPQ